MNKHEFKNTGIEVLRRLKKAGTDYGDIRFTASRRQNIAVEDKRVKIVGDVESAGFGIRVLLHGSWGFAASSCISPEEALKCSEIAIEIAKASARARKGKGVKLAEQEPVVSTWRTEVIKDPFEVPLEGKIALLMKASDQVMHVKGVAKFYGNMFFIKESKFIMTSSGSELDTENVVSSVGITATATLNGDARSRNYFPPELTKGYELVDEAEILKHGERIAEQAVEHVRATPCPQGKRDLVLLPSHLCLTIHESVGHATELDRAVGMEESLAGRSFATPDKLNTLKYGSKIVNFIADNTLAHGLATTGFDDDGVPGQKYHIVREGIFSGYSTSREVAHIIGENSSRGCSRADSWRHIPIVRIPNLGLAPGKEKCTPEDLIGDVRDGILIDGIGSFSIDQMRYNFQFGGDAFWEIKNGKLTRMLKDVTYQAITTDFWNSCDAICDSEHWKPYGIMNCGKGKPEQTARMTHGAAAARFRNISVGGIKP